MYQLKLLLKIILKSEKYASLLYPKIQKQTIEEELTYQLLSSPEAIMQPFIYLLEHYGSISGYLQAIGMNKVNIQRLQTILIN